MSWTMSFNRYAKYAWGVLAYNILVILWGAFVRATGSGAGCGSHWPLCNGEVIPRAAQVETMIEFTHRLTSGLALLLVVGLLVWGLRAYPRGHIVRKGAVFSMLFIITEALLGAGLVIFELVAEDSSSMRAFSIALHLVNTFLLLAALSLTAWWASGGEPLSFRGQGNALTFFALAFVGIIFLGMSGAITALGDTLFPVESLSEGLQADFSPDSHFLIRLRVWHPLAAVLVGFYLMFFGGLVAMFRSDKYTRSLAIALVALIIIQLLAGLVNLLLLAPIWMQILHLLLADLLWISLVLLTGAYFARSESPQAVLQETGSVQDAPAR